MLYFGSGLVAMTSTNDIRQAFLDYFEGNDHEVVASSSLVPHNDPTLLFTNAGMVQFKNVFTGVESRPYSRAATSQKCVRAGGKHNDLENVGYTARHHTFFEMLGNFSFGDYFKERAIELAWDLLTKQYGLPADRLLTTVYADDDEAFELWRKIAGLSEDRVIRISTSDNFWEMGETGPCGPCSEIFYDHGSSVAGGPPGTPDEDGDRFIEVWNLVFMQYEKTTPDNRTSLPRPSIDTGMGLERLAAILQGKHDNYDTDALRVLIEASAELSGVAPDGEHAVSHRVIADHLRSCSFLIADGVLPSNEGRGYVLRRIMRRAMRHAHTIGCKEPLMYRLVPAIVNEMGGAYPELIRAQALVRETFKLEEERFRETLGRGLRLLNQETDQLSHDASLPGEVAFRLYDTYGFPLDLTEDILRSQGRRVDTQGFEACMSRQREAARKAWAGSGDAATETVWFDIRERVGATEFLGYSSDMAEAQVAALVVDGAEVEEIESGADASIVTSQTPFYGESGGQIGDTGVIFTSDGAEFAVRDTVIKLGDLYVHQGEVTRGRFVVDGTCELRIDKSRRAALRANHSATHLLHAALRRRLGEHVTQKGSLVAADRLRFDISHPKPLSEDEIAEVEVLVNTQIRSNKEVATRLMAPAAAIEAGALALFGEKYGDEVRVVSMGEDEAMHFSTELCGGTHVRRTGDIGLFTIVSEGGVAAGVRRIEALTGSAAERFVAEQTRLLSAAGAALRVKPADVPARVTQLLEERRRLERELSEARQQVATGSGANGAALPAKTVAGIAFSARRLDDVPAKDLRPMADAMKKQVGSGVVALATVAEGKASLVVGVTADLTGRFNAVDLVRVGVAELGGKGGGGRPDMAQGGGPDSSGADGALAAIEKAIAS